MILVISPYVAASAPPSMLTLQIILQNSIVLQLVFARKGTGHFHSKMYANSMKMDFKLAHLSSIKDGFFQIFHGVGGE